VEAAGQEGSGVGRFVRATGAGLGAALGGFLLYFTISTLTGYEFGLIAIVVGVAVGKAVAWGARGRGGWRYQTLAMALTYLAIVATYIPPLVQGIRESRREVTASQTSAGSTTPVAAASAAQTTEEPAEPPTFGRMLFALAVLLLVACAAPFLVGLQNIMGIVIIGIGVYEAWKFNRRVPLVITGPHAIVTAPAVAAPAAR